MKEINWVSHIEFMVLLVTLLGTFYLLDGKIERQSTRTDRLYEMYVETQKEIMQLRIDWLNSIRDRKISRYDDVLE